MKTLTLSRTTSEKQAIEHWENWFNDENEDSNLYYMFVIMPRVHMCKRVYGVCLCVCVSVCLSVSSAKAAE